jgi:kynurenine formamidase
MEAETPTNRRTAAVHGWRPGEGWGWVWGEDDELGALNAMTPESMLEALRGVREGRVYDLGITVERRSYLGPFHVHTEVVSYRSSGGLRRELLAAGLDPGDVSFNTSMVMVSDHAGTQIDGLCHATAGTDDHWYNGWAGDRDRDDFGAVRASVAGMPPIILGAVLVDVAGHLGVPCLEAGFPIGPELVSAALAERHVDIAPGEAVLIRTGALRHWGEVGLDHDSLAGPDTAGITLAAARWLVEEKGAILVGSDTSTLEVVPNVDGDSIAPVHRYLLVEQGVHMGELHFLEELAAAGVHRFCYIALTPKIRGTTGGFALRPVAIV